MRKSLETSRENEKKNLEFIFMSLYEQFMLFYGMNASLIHSIFF